MLEWLEAVMLEIGKHRQCEIDIQKSGNKCSREAQCNFLEALKFSRNSKCLFYANSSINKKRRILPNIKS